MNIAKTDVLFVLSKRPGKWVKPKKIAKELNLNTTEGINRISNILYRSRHIPHIERKRNSRACQYRYCEEIKGHPTLENPYPKIEGDEKGIGDSDNFNGFSFVEPLVEMEEGYCELCDKFTQVSFKAQRDGCLILLCEAHGRAVDKMLCGYGGVFA